MVIGSLMEDEETQSTVSVTRDTLFSGVRSISGDAEDCLQVVSVTEVCLFGLALLLLLLSITNTAGFMLQVSVMEHVLFCCLTAAVAVDVLECTAAAVVADDIQIAVLTSHPFTSVTSCTFYSSVT